MVATNQFENTNGTEWTSLENGVAFLQIIANETGVPLDSIGTSFKGNELWRLKVGTGSRDVLFTGGVHMSEHAGRETVLRKARDVAYNSDGRYSEYLSKYTVHFVPTVNPDAVPISTRHNGQNLDINRDTYLLKTPEGNALISLIADLLPDVHVDFHERSGTYEPTLENIEFIRTMFFYENADPEVKRLADNMVSYMINTLKANNYPGATYYPPSIIGPGMMTGASGILGSVEMVPETYFESPDKTFRVNALSQVFEQIIDWHLANEAEVSRARDGFNGRMLKPGDSYVLLNGDSAYYTSATKVPITLPEGYLLSNPSEFSAFTNVYNIEIDETGFVPINQTAGRLLPRLLDPSSDIAITSATRVEPVPKPTNGRYTKVMYDTWREVFIKSYSTTE